MTFEEKRDKYLKIVKKTLRGATKLTYTIPNTNAELADHARDFMELYEHISFCDDFPKLSNNDKKFVISLYNTTTGGNQW